MWVWPSFAATHSDEWCSDSANVVPPEMVMPAHTAPLGISFFGAQEAHLSSPPPCTAEPALNSSTEAAEVGSGDGGGGGGGSGGGGDGAFPCYWAGDAFVLQHGSWNRDVPIGYAVVRLPFDSAGGRPSGEVATLLAHGGQGAKWPSGSSAQPTARSTGAAASWSALTSRTRSCEYPTTTVRHRRRPARRRHHPARRHRPARRQHRRRSVRRH